MNLGQFLTQYSPLPSGTVAQHLLAIAQNQGAGQGTVFCSQFVVTVERSEITVTRKAKRRAAPEPAQVVRSPIANNQQKHITAFRSEPRLVAFHNGPDEITVINRSKRIN